VPHLRARIHLSRQTLVDVGSEKVFIQKDTEDMHSMPGGKCRECGATMGVHIQTDTANRSGPEQLFQIRLLDV
jgi:hypothetical protein